MTLATDILGLDQEPFSAAFGKSPMKRATLAGLGRNASVIMRNAASADGSSSGGVTGRERGAVREVARCAWARDCWVPLASGLH